MSFTFNKENALGADAATSISTGGVYKGELTRAALQVYDSGAESVSFNFKSDSGSKAKYMNIFTKKKNLEAAFGAKKIQSLMGILQIREAVETSHEKDDNYDCFCGRKIAIAIQKVNTPGKKYPFKLEIMHFLDYTTLKTYREKSNSEEALTSEQEIPDKWENEQPQQTGQSQLKPSATLDDDLPF